MTQFRQLAWRDERRKAYLAQSGGRNQLYAETSNSTSAAKTTTLRRPKQVCLLRWRLARFLHNRFPHCQMPGLAKGKFSLSNQNRNFILLFLFMTRVLYSILVISQVKACKLTNTCDNDYYSQYEFSLSNQNRILILNTKRKLIIWFFYQLIQSVCTYL